MVIYPFDIIKAATNSTYTQEGVSCSYEREVLNPIFVHLMKFSAKTPERPPQTLIPHPTTQHQQLT
jgi:hypothetical protein